MEYFDESLHTAVEWIEASSRTFGMTIALCGAQSQKTHTITQAFMHFGQDSAEQTLYHVVLPYLWSVLNTDGRSVWVTHRHIIGLGGRLVVDVQPTDLTRLEYDTLYVADPEMTHTRCLRARPRPAFGPPEFTPDYISLYNLGQLIGKTYLYIAEQKTAPADFRAPFPRQPQWFATFGHTRAAMEALLKMVADVLDNNRDLSPMFKLCGLSSNEAADLARRITRCPQCAQRYPDGSTDPAETVRRVFDAKTSNSVMVAYQIP